MKKVALILTLGPMLFFQMGAERPQQGNVFAITFLKSPILQTPEHGGQIESKYDGFNHETVVKLRKMKVTCAGKKGNFKDTCVSLVASLHCPGIQLDYVRYATLQLNFETKDWDQRHTPDQRILMVVADGETLKLGRMELVSQNVDTLMSEVLQVRVPYRTFRKIALAQVIEVEVGNSKFELREKNLAALRDLNNRVKL